jgi:hypothetical protein
MRLIIAFFYCTSLVFGQSHIKNERELIKGLSLVAPPKPYSVNAFKTIKEMNSSWVAIVPYAFCRVGDPIVHYNHQEKDTRWWGESRTGVEETVCLAKDQGLKIMLKPQVWVGHEWIGNLSFQKVQEWEQWEASYEAYILPFAEMCQTMDVELLCIGTEIKQSVKLRPLFWHNLISKIRKIYHGKLTYASNWDEYDLVSFWSKLDYIGVNAYFPLCYDLNPTEEKLTESWTPILDKLERTSKKFDRPILFTEYGYLSIDGCGGETWKLEANLQSANYNPEAQSRCLHVLLDCCSKQKFWSGGFLWKWYDDPNQNKESMQRDHTPQGKPAEEVVRKWYAKM